MPAYRTNGAWGSGIGVNLTPAQVDGNFYELRTDLDDLIANPPDVNSIATIAASGFTWTVTLTDGTILDPLPVPVVYTVWRGDWAPFTLYSAADLFRVEDQGIFAVLQDHTSAATFDPDEAGGSPLAQHYTQLIGVSTLPVDTLLDELSDVTITSVAVGDFLVWTGSLWANQTTAVVRGMLTVPDNLDDLADVDAPSPTLGQVLTWTGSPASWRPATPTSSLDSLSDVSVPGPSNGQVLTYQAGSPTGWIAATPAAIPTTLDALTDVVAPSPADGDFLQYESGSPAGWVNVAGTGISGLPSVSLPLLGSDLILVSEGVGSPPASYQSGKATIGDLLSAGGFILGSTSIALGGTTTTVGGLTLSGGTLSGATTLPASGQITATGELGIGGAATARISISGTYTTANDSAFRLTGVLQSSDTAAQAMIAVSGIFEPQGASLTQILALRFEPQLNSTAFSISFARAVYADFLFGAGFTGTVATTRLFEAADVTSANGTLSTVQQFAGVTLTNGNGITSGSRTNAQFVALGITAGAAGGTLNNRGVQVTVPSGGASSGTANNRGVYITGNGGAGTGSPPGTVNNFALLSDSTAYSRIEGGLGVGVGSAQATNATSPFLYIPACAGAPTGVPNNAAAGAIALVWDSTNKKLMAYDQPSATWKGVVLA